MRKDILENANTYTLSDFQKLKMAESYKKLYSDTILDNAKRKKEQYDKIILKLLQYFIMLISSNIQVFFANYLKTLRK
jgi:hypothetical protein